MALTCDEIAALTAADRYLPRKVQAVTGDLRDPPRVLGVMGPVEHATMTAKDLPKLSAEQVALGLESPKWREYVGLAASTIRDLAADLSLAKAERDAADEISRTSQSYVAAMESTCAAARTVLETFEKDEAQGYRSKDREYAIAIIRGAMQPCKERP